MNENAPHAKPGIFLPPPAWFVLGLVAGVMIDRALQYVVRLPFAFEIAGWAFAVVGTWIAIWAEWTFMRHKTGANPYKAAKALATDGPYRFTRNPMYVAMTLVYIGVALIWSTVIAMALLPVVILAINKLVIEKEERHLRAKFGEEYEEYLRRVRRWV